jgi:hypothetical protein
MVQVNEQTDSIVSSGSFMEHIYSHFLICDQIYVGHPMKPHRVRMVHNLVVNYGLYKKLSIVVCHRKIDGLPGKTDMDI